MNEYDNCPKCGASWIGEPIPADIVEHYSGSHWRREIGIDGGYAGIYDGTVAIMCPDCETVMPRNDSAWATDLFNRYLKSKTEEL